VPDVNQQAAATPAKTAAKPALTKVPAAPAE